MRRLRRVGGRVDAPVWCPGGRHKIRGSKAGRYGIALARPTPTAPLGRGRPRQNLLLAHDPASAWAPGGVRGGQEFACLRARLLGVPAGDGKFTTLSTFMDTWRQ